MTLSITTYREKRCNNHDVAYVSPNSLFFFFFCNVTYITGCVCGVPDVSNASTKKLNQIYFPSCTYYNLSWFLVFINVPVLHLYVRKYILLLLNVVKNVDVFYILLTTIKRCYLSEGSRLLPIKS